MRRWWPLPVLALLAVGAAMAAKPFAGMPAPTMAASTMAGTASARTVPFDTAHSRVGFRLATRWGQRLRGEFPAYEGEVHVDADGRRAVRVVLDSTRMEVVGHPRYTRWARGPDFFDVARFPTIEFRSETYGDALLRDGGPLPDFVHEERDPSAARQRLVTGGEASQEALHA